MTVDVGVAEPGLQAAVSHRPGYCSEHPNQRLVTPRQAGAAGWGLNPHPVACVMPHAELERDRCRNCGGELWPADAAGVRPTRFERFRPKQYCTPNCRLVAHRRARKAARS